MGYICSYYDQFIGCILVNAETAHRARCCGNGEINIWEESFEYRILSC